MTDEKDKILIIERAISRAIREAAEEIYGPAVTELALADVLTAILMVGFQYHRFGISANKSGVEQAMGYAHVLQVFGQSNLRCETEEAERRKMLN